MTFQLLMPCHARVITLPSTYSHSYIHTYALGNIVFFGETRVRNPMHYEQEGVSET